MKRCLVVAVAVLMLVGVSMAGERKTETLFGLQYSDVDNVGASGTAMFEWSVPVGNTIRVGPMAGLTYLSPDDGESFTGYEAGGLVAFDFGNESAFFVEGTLLYALGDLNDVIDYTYGVGGGYKVWSGNVVVKLKAAYEQVKFEVTGETEDRIVSSVAIGFGR